MTILGAGLRGETFPAVLVAAQAGASWALSDLWLQFAPAVTGFLRSKGSSEPEDLTSDVFLAVFDSIAEFEGDESAFRSFVFTIAYRRLVDELRKRARRGTVVEWTAETDTRCTESAEQEALGRMGEERARALIEELPIDQRNVLSLRIFGDLTIEQIADVVGKNPGAVKALQRRGLEALRRRLDPTRTPAAR
ncbi:RNA polymerase sigma factor [Lysobacter korlensis]|uniref:RNA polymerase sigma factor n=1 Tax=Lysobacter korlensis TaxID=553636 RepID=A0ABV6S3W2_9GAMM